MISEEFTGVNDIRATKSTFAGLFFTAFATLAYEVVLTRIFSVTVWYHFAFLVVSLSMFGMTAGALYVHLFPGFFPQRDIKGSLSLFASLLALAVPVAYLTHVSAPVVIELRFLCSAAGCFTLLANCLVLSLPFIFSGICICLSLTRFPLQVCRLYAADLIGAACACPAVACLLEFTDGPSTLLVASVFAALAAVCFAPGGQTSRQLRLALGSFCLLFLLTSVNIFQVINRQESLFRLVWIKGAPAVRTIYERWNSFSAVRVLGDPQRPFPPSGWGLNPAFMKTASRGQLVEDIDGCAATPIPGFAGDFQDVTYLKADVTNIAHYLLNGAKVLVVGVGGGRDVLSALAFKQSEVLGVELNRHILEALTKEFAEFSGHLERFHNVRLVNDEARSYLSRSPEKFDLIQISLVDTFAATSAGAFALAENSLYTKEGWQIFFDHLSNRGIISVSRWYVDAYPAEIYRLLSLSAASLKSAGVKDPRQHLALVECNAVPGSTLPGVGTLIVSRFPLSREQMEKLTMVAGVLDFKIMLSPSFAEDEKLALIADQKLPCRDLEEKFPSRISPPTDDCPYFFQLGRYSLFGNNSGFHSDNHMQAVFILSAFTLALSVLLAACIFLPLKIRSAAAGLNRSLPLSIYFISTGMGFMLIEISQIQRLSIFLGNPGASLSAVLFSMLTFTGLGSLLTAWLEDRRLVQSAVLRMICICLVIFVVGILTPVCTGVFTSAPMPVRILVAVLLLAPLGLACGTAFPTGMKMAVRSNQDLTAWLWAINGAASVYSSVLAVFCSISFGISFSYFLALFCYGLAAWAAFRWVRSAGPDQAIF